MHIRARAAQRSAKALPLGSSGIPAAVAVHAAPLGARPDSPAAAAVGTCDTTLALPTAEDIALYEVHFGVHNEAGFVGAMSAKACLEEACGGALSNQVLAGIWVLCDADGDGRLGKLEFYLAVHIVLHMAKGRLTAVPHVTPALLGHLTNALKASVSGVPQAAPTVHPQAASTVPQAAPTDRSTGTIPAADEQWRLDAAAVAQFSRIFADACAAAGPGTDRLGKSQAGAVLAMSGLPTEVLLSIWSLADVNGDDRLDLRGYLLCCWLVQRSVQKQLPPPTSLPPELLASATGAASPPAEPQPAVSSTTEPRPIEPPSTEPQLPAIPVEEEEFGFDGGGFGDTDFSDGFSDAPARGFGDDNSGLGDDNGGFCGDNGGLGDGGARTCGSTPQLQCNRHAQPCKLPPSPSRWWVWHRV